MYQCILNVPLSNNWGKVTYSQVHGSPVLKTLLYRVSSEFLRQDPQSSYSFGKIQNVGETELSEEKKLALHWRKTSYFVFIYIFPLVLFLISSFQIHNLELER